MDGSHNAFAQIDELSAPDLPPARDPAWFKLTETSNYLRWEVFGNGTVTWRNYSEGCWAANPSPIQTHWFVNWCSHPAPFYENGNTNVLHQAAGAYYNWDFENNNEQTTVTQSSLIRGKNDATYTYTWSHVDGGEAAGLLVGSVVVQ